MDALSPRTLRRTPLALLALAGCAAAALAQSPDVAEREPDDALPREQRALVDELTDRDMPELVEELLAGAPTMHRIHIARAYAKAAIGAKADVERQKFLEKASSEYRRALTLARDSNWLRGLRRRYDIALWQVELSELILRRQAAPDLDRYEVTSGLDYDRPRIVGLLNDAHLLYRQSAVRLDELLVGLRTQEEQYLLLGLAAKIARLAEQRRLNAAWTAVYLAMVDRDPAESANDPGAPGRRQALLDGALADFDALARSARDSEQKYNALLGAGVALRESGRTTEAHSAFDRVRLSVASSAVIIRARFEQSRTHLAAGEFDAARRELAELERTNDPDGASNFYQRLAPLVTAYSYLLESKAAGRNAASRAALRDKAAAEFNEIAKQGGPWTEIAQVYLAALRGPRQNLAELGDAELSLLSARWMKEAQYRQAIEPLTLLLSRADKDPERTEAAFNLAVCRFQIGDLSAAAEQFEGIAREESRGDLAEQAAVYAYHCRRQIANSEKSTANYDNLTRAATHLADRYPRNDLAGEARWVAALAHQETGQWNRALEAYARIPEKSSRYRSARWGIAICRQRLYDQLAPDAAHQARREAAKAAADAWIAVAGMPTTTSTASQPSVDEANLAAAELLAGPDLERIDDALSILQRMPQSERVLLLRLRCLTSRGDEAAARREFDAILNDASGAQRGPLLAALAAHYEGAARRLQKADRTDDAKKNWSACAGILRELIAWMDKQPDGDELRRAAIAARVGLAEALVQLGEFAAARAQYDELIAADPANGDHLRRAALLEEQLAASSSHPDAADRAEAQWGRLLEDASLRQRSPEVYWEARYYWLAHQLRHGRAADVWKGIESEKAWFPDLGGPPWQGRLLELAAKAREADGRGDSQ
ncbi:MAG TPA: hypothetical protein VJZ71_01130 [Phycisphaerae bacterium]|nr:hypothetical protein [Phycisphaerae bacterium]